MCPRLHSVELRPHRGDGVAKFCGDDDGARPDDARRMVSCVSHEIRIDQRDDPAGEGDAESDRQVFGASIIKQTTSPGASGCDRSHAAYRFAALGEHGVAQRLRFGEQGRAVAECLSRPLGDDRRVILGVPRDRRGTCGVRAAAIGRRHCVGSLRSLQA